MFKKYCKLVFTLTAVSFFSLVSFYILPLPATIAEAVLTARLNKFSPDYKIKLKKAEFFLLRGLKADYIYLTKNGYEVSSLKNLNLKHSVLFIFNGTGDIKATAGELNIKRNAEKNVFFNFLTNTLNWPAEEELKFQNLVVNSKIKRGKIIIKQFELAGSGLKMNASGFFEKEKQIDFNINLFLSEKFTGGISEKIKKMMSEVDENGFIKINFKIYGLPHSPYYKIKTNFFELDIS